jgi:serine/threonine protein kinase
VPRLDAAEIYARALECEDPEGRAAFLLEACEQDLHLRHRIEALLAARAARGDFLEAPLVEPGACPRGSESPGMAIGPYLLMEEIGEGGMGVVYLAQQSAPVKRRVALKILRPGLDTRTVIARFEAERQALALMEHPSLAKIIDAGTADSGRPYFVMELVQGVPITEYCDVCQLTVRERLELMIAVCQAVQHAHEKGVIHRDLKPTNILVAVQDGRPLPKIIDFGVAKATGHRLTDSTLATGFAQMVGTPLYMSPEQAELSPIGVDERTDVYALGVLLYELLAGTTPFDKAQLHDASLDELRRIIREVEPLRPALRFSTLEAEQATTVVERRRSSVRGMRQTLRGELEWIVMRCLEKNRTHRYASAIELAADLGRYLSNQPVTARPPTAFYKLWKLARRHKVLAGMTVAAAGLAPIAIVALTWQARTYADTAAAERQYQLAGEMRSQGKLEQAEAHLNEAIRLRPASARFWADRALLHADQHRADAAVSDLKMAIGLDPAHTTYPELLSSLGMEHGQWEDAIDAHRLLLKIAPHNHLHWYRYAVLSLFTGDEEEYRRCCRELLNRFGRTHDPRIADRTAKTCMLTPDAVADLQPVLKLVEMVTDDYERNVSMSWFPLLSGLAAYRAGDAATAVSRLNSISLDPHYYDFNGTVFAILALAHLDLEQFEEAEIWLERADECLAHWPDSERGESFDYWGDWLRFRILFDEANRAMKSMENRGMPRAS